MDRQFWLGLVLGGAGALALVGLLAPERPADVAPPTSTLSVTTSAPSPSTAHGGGPSACACPTIDPLTEFFRGALPSECFASPTKSCEPRTPVVWWWPMPSASTTTTPTTAPSSAPTSAPMTAPAVVAAPTASSAPAMEEEGVAAPSASASAATSADASLEWDPFAPVIDPFGPTVPR